MKKVLILGGKGTASVIAHSIIHANKLGYDEYEFAGFINDHEKEIDGLPVVGGFSDVDRLVRENFYFINTVYKIGGQEERMELFKNLNIPDENLCTFIHPSAYIAPGVKIGAGSVVSPNASISTMTQIGRCCLIMNNVSIGHDNRIGDFNFFTANSCLGSYIETGDGAWFGLNCTVRGKLTIGNKSTVGIGAVVTKNIGDNEIWVGNPAKFHKTNSDRITM